MIPYNMGVLQAFNTFLEGISFRGSSEFLKDSKNKTAGFHFN